MLLLFMFLLGCFTSIANCLSNYDFIIVGGGTAGLAVARRLAESGKYSVLVLETGGLPKEGQDVPAFAPRFLVDPDVTFQYQTTPQRNAALGNSGVVSIYAGRMLGGTSVLNYMSAERGHPKDYDNWANLTQDNTWNYSNMLQHMKRSEHYDGDFPSDHHGYNGPITVSRPRFAPGLKEWLEAGKSLGYSIIDPSGPQKTGFAPMEYSKRHGRRCCAFVGYIQPILESKPKLQIVINTTVTQIIFKGKRAVGVRFQSQTPELQGIPNNSLYANKEIIISAGNYGSPQVLLRSGIGPRNVLVSSGIPIVQELPVGQHFQDHAGVPVPIIISNRAAVMDAKRDLTPENWEIFSKFGDGPYSSTQGTTGQAYLVSPVAESDGEHDWPDVHLILWASTEAYRGDSPLLMVNASSMASWEVPMTITIFLVRPKSRGTVQLNSSDPHGLPILDGGYLSDSRDIEKCLHGIKEIIRIFEKTPIYKGLGARIPFIDIPMCRQFPFRTDNYWRCFIRYASHTGCHSGSSCKMGSGANDPEATVDSKLRVIGVERLRVVDASIMPVLTNANTHAAVYAIAEKASEMILKEWGSDGGHEDNYGDEL